jgi:pilus assembly protein Flp/PilA
MNAHTLSRLLRDDEGATMVEYSLIVALIAVATIIALSYLGGRVKSLFSTVGNSVHAA